VSRNGKVKEFERTNRKVLRIGFGIPPSVKERSRHYKKQCSPLLPKKQKEKKKKKRACGGGDKGETKKGIDF